MTHLVDEEDLLVILVHLDDLADIRMIQLFQKFDLLKKLAALSELQVFLADDLDGSRDAGELVDTAADSAQSTFSDDLMELKVILDVVLMVQVELLRVELDSMALVGVVISPVLEEGLEVLSREGHELFRLLSDNFLDEVLEDAGERVGNVDLLG